MKGFGDLYKSKKKINRKIKLSKEQVINQAFKFHQEGNILEAAKYYQLFIDQGSSDERVFSNFGAPKDLGNLKEAESSYPKQLQLI